MAFISASLILPLSAGIPSSGMPFSMKRTYFSSVKFFILSLVKSLGFIALPSIVTLPPVPSSLWQLAQKCRHVATICALFSIPLLRHSTLMLPQNEKIKEQPRLLLLSAITITHPHHGEKKLLKIKDKQLAPIMITINYHLTRICL